MSPPSGAALAQTDGHSKGVFESFEWVTGLMSVLDLLQATLTRLIKACVHFDQYELPALIGGQPSSQLVPYIQEIRQSINELHIVQDDLVNMCRRAQQFRQKSGLRD
ncbi:hypothetical protein PG984_008513 [Apiospora sp. TS-2023a]